MGRKERVFAPIVAPSLDDLVPANHFYRHLETKLDLTFVRELVQGLRQISDKTAGERVSVLVRCWRWWLVACRRSRCPVPAVPRP